MQCIVYTTRLALTMDDLLHAHTRRLTVGVLALVVYIPRPIRFNPSYFLGAWTHVYIYYLEL